MRGETCLGKSLRRNYPLPLLQRGSLVAALLRVVKTSFSKQIRTLYVSGVKGILGTGRRNWTLLVVGVGSTATA